MSRVQVLAGRYRLIELLGTGGMSVVWRGYDEVLGRQVAVKVLSAEQTADSASRDRLRTEAQAAARLSHPNVTGVYDYGESTAADGSPMPYVVMELLEGVSLADRLARGRLPWRTAVRIGAQVAAALAAAHARGLVHRDVKPANIMLTLGGVKVLDFGIAAVAGQHGDIAPDGTLLGTPAYLAPERLLGAPVSPASDVYALGVVLYRSLTGQSPFTATTLAEMVSAHCGQPPAPLPPISGLPDEVAEACMRCLDKSAANRPTSGELARVLATAAGLRAVPATLGGIETSDLAIRAPRTVVAGRRGRPTGTADNPATAARVSGQTPVEASTEPIVVTAETSLVARSSVTGSRTTQPVWPVGRRRRLVRVAGAGAGLVAAAMLVATCSDVRDADRPRVVAAADAAGVSGSTGAGGGTGDRPCEVRYETRADLGTTFDVQVTVRNTGSRPLSGWRLQFDLSGGQAVLAGRGGDWTQNGSQVTVTVPGQLDPAASATVGFTGSYVGSNPMPAAFRVNGAECGQVLVGATTGSVAGTAVSGATTQNSAGGGSDNGGGRGKGKGKGHK
jgi:tRNA A-37 threonylcarbamoyl transferase component Bud32